MVVLYLHAFDRVLSVNEADGLTVVVRLHRAVHDDDISLIHIGVYHRYAVNAEEECGGRMTDQQLGQVQPLPDIAGWGRESGLDFTHIGKVQRFCYGLGLHTTKIAIIYSVCSFFSVLLLLV